MNLDCNIGLVKYFSEPCKPFFLIFMKKLLKLFLSKTSLRAERSFSLSLSCQHFSGTQAAKICAELVRKIRLTDHWNRFVQHSTGEEILTLTLKEPRKIFTFYDDCSISPRIFQSKSFYLYSVTLRLPHI